VTRYPRGISKRPEGWRISISVNGTIQQRSFPPDTPQTVVEAKLLEYRSRWTAGTRSAQDGTLGADVARYLNAFFGQRPGREERERHLELWIKALGRETWRREISREDVSRVLHGWRAAFAADTCNKRRAALLAFYNAVDGKAGANPVRDVPKFRTMAPLPRGLSYTQIAKAFKKLPKCRTRARLKVMAYTGARPIQVRRLTPDDWDDKAHTLILHATEKGQGTKPHCVPLSAQAQAALREFEDTDAWGSFTMAPMGRMWKAAVTAAGVKTATRVYDLRHSFGTAVYRSTGDVRVTKDLLGHSTIAMTERYTLSAIPERQRAAILAFEAVAKGRKLPAHLPMVRNTQRKR
jgi:integrase